MENTLGVKINNLLNCGPKFKKLNKQTGCYTPVLQDEFIKEYYPEGHKIFDRVYFPDEYKKDEQGRIILYPVPRCAFPFQYIITVKQLTHLCGNYIRITNTDIKRAEEQKEIFDDLKQGWLKKDMEIAFYRLAKSVKIVGCGAFVGYIKEGQMGWKVLSHLNGDDIYAYPDFEKPDIFARRYTQYNILKGMTETFMEVWDNRYQYTFIQESGLVGKIKEFFSLDGWRLYKEPEIHGFSFCPVTGMLDPNGPCWSFSQDNIEGYEKLFSLLMRINTTLAFPILVVEADVFEVDGNDNQPVKFIRVDQGGSAKMLSGGDVSNSYKLGLETLLKGILMGSFIVIPPEERSGDQSGVSIKIKYSPALELAQQDAKAFSYPIKRMLAIFKEGYGIERGAISRYNELNLTTEIIPYVHQNEEEIINNLARAVEAGFLSKESAAEECDYAATDELERLIKEKKSGLSDKEETIEYKSEKQNTEIIKEEYDTTDDVNISR